MLGHRLDDAIASADVVEQEIAVGVEGDATECIGNGESAAVDFCSGRSSGQRGDVAGGAANFVEEVGTSFGRRGRGL